MDGLSYDRDIRHEAPDTDGYRRQRFKSGWNDDADRDRHYTDKTLERLTWNNLGYRFGRILGHASGELQGEMYELCVRQQRERHDL